MKFKEKWSSALALIWLISCSTPALAASDSVEMLLQQGRYREAEIQSQKSVSDMAERYGVNHQQYYSALSIRALVLQKLGRHDEAEILFNQSITFVQETYGPQNFSLVILFSNLATSKTDQRKYSEAETLLRRALAIRG